LENGHARLNNQDVGTKSAAEGKPPKEADDEQIKKTLKPQPPTEVDVDNIEKGPQLEKSSHDKTILIRRLELIVYHFRWFSMLPTIKITIHFFNSPFYDNTHIMNIKIDETGCAEEKLKSWTFQITQRKLMHGERQVSRQWPALRLEIILLIGSRLKVINRTKLFLAFLILSNYCQRGLDVFRGSSEQILQMWFNIMRTCYIFRECARNNLSNKIQHELI